MRALILLECLVAIGLSVAVFLKGGGAAAVETPDVFNASRLLLDAVPNEEATYRLDDGRTTLSFKVLATDFGGLGGPPGSRSAAPAPRTVRSSPNPSRTTSTTSTGTASSPS